LCPIVLDRTLPDSAGVLANFEETTVTLKSFNSRSFGQLLDVFFKQAASQSMTDLLGRARVSGLRSCSKMKHNARC
jgi:hypothetical protein